MKEKNIIKLSSRPKRKFYTIGYGGRKPDKFLKLLKKKGIKTVVDIRLRPDKASMGIYAKAKPLDKGIQKLLSASGIEYVSLIELGNIFLEYENWRDNYSKLLSLAGDLLTQRLKEVRDPFCLMCSEKNPEDCHRKLISEYLLKSDYEAEHIK